MGYREVRPLEQLWYIIKWKVRAVLRWVWKGVHK